MQHKYCITIVHRIFSNFMQNNHLFDEILIVFENDFAQILSVMKNDSRFEIVDANLQQFFIWSLFMKLFLTKNMRVCHEIDNKIFVNWLNKMFYESTFYDHIKLFKKIINRTQNLQTFTNSVFSSQLLSQINEYHKFFKNWAIFMMHNNIVTNLKNLILKSLSKELHIMNSIDKIAMNEIQVDLISTEHLRNFNFFFLSSTRLRFKIEAFIMLLQNFCFKYELCNNTWLIVMNIHRIVLKIRILKKIEWINTIDLLNFNQ